MSLGIVHTLIATVCTITHFSPNVIFDGVPLLSLSLSLTLCAHTPCSLFYCTFPAIHWAKYTFSKKKSVVPFLFAWEFALIFRTKKKILKKESKIVELLLNGCHYHMFREYVNRKHYQKYLKWHIHALRIKFFFRLYFSASAFCSLSACKTTTTTTKCLFQTLREHRVNESCDVISRIYFSYIYRCTKKTA